jgi:hypothetical protein
VFGLHASGSEGSKEIDEVDEEDEEDEESMATSSGELELELEL